MPVVVIGKECKLYIGTAGTQAATLVGNVRDLTLTLERAEIDASARDSGDWVEVVPGMKAATIEFELRWIPADANFATIRDAFLNGTAIACLIVDGLKTVTGVQGLDGDFVVLGFSRPEPLQDLVTARVTIKPTPSTRAQAWWVKA
jgi:predicted secreted protein